MPRVMVVTASHNQAPLISKAKAMGHVVLATDRDADAPALLLADFTAAVDALDKDALLNAARDFRPDAIVSEQTDVAIPAVAYVAESLGLPGIDLATAIRTTDKFAMREACRQAGIINPRFRLASTLDQAVAAAADVGFPLIFKPADNQASRGVTKVEGPERVVAAAGLAFAASRSHRIMVEECMTGEELSVESFICNDAIHVLGVCAKKKFSQAQAFDRELIYPGGHPPERLAEIYALNSNVIAAVGLHMGFSHAEMMVTSEGVRLIEIAARGCGSRIATDLLPRLTNIDLLALRLSQALGEKVTIPKVDCRSFGILRFLDFQEGTVCRVAGLHEAAAEPGVLWLECRVQVGTRLAKPRSGDQRHGYILGVAESRAGALALADKVTRLIEIDVI